MNNIEHPHYFLRFSPFLKRFSINVIIIFTATMLQFYWSMGELSENMSSSCMSCGFFEDNVFMSVCTGIFLSVIFPLFSFIKKAYIKTLIEFLLLILIWILWNHSIFVDREASWSTYDFESEMHYTLSLSCIPIIILGSGCVFLLHLREIKNFRP